MKLSIEYGKPIGNGIVTCFNLKQAKERSKKKVIKNQIKVQRLPSSNINIE